MKEKSGRIFRIVTVGCTIILVFLIVTGCVDFGKAWGAITGIFGAAGTTARQNLDTVIKVALGIAVGAAGVSWLHSRKKK